MHTEVDNLTKSDGDVKENSAKNMVDLTGLRIGLDSLFLYSPHERYEGIIFAGKL
jgi:hypothetical protein